MKKNILRKCRTGLMLTIAGLSLAIVITPSVSADDIHSTDVQTTDVQSTAPVAGQVDIETVKQQLQEELATVSENIKTVSEAISMDNEERISESVTETPQLAPNTTKEVIEEDDNKSANVFEAVESVSDGISEVLEKSTVDTSVSTAKADQVEGDDIVSEVNRGEEKEITVAVEEVSVDGEIEEITVEKTNETITPVANKTTITTQVVTLANDRTNTSTTSSTITTQTKQYQASLTTSQESVYSEQPTLPKTNDKSALVSMALGMAMTMFGTKGLVLKKKD